jgi:hypothetical protein
MMRLCHASQHKVVRSSGHLQVGVIAAPARAGRRRACARVFKICRRKKKNVPSEPKRHWLEASQTVAAHSPRSRSFESKSLLRGAVLKAKGILFAFMPCRRFSQSHLVILRFVIQISVTLFTKAITIRSLWGLSTFRFQAKSDEISRHYRHAMTVMAGACRRIWGSGQLLF